MQSYLDALAMENRRREQAAEAEEAENNESEQ